MFLLGFNLLNVFKWKDTEGISEFYQLPSNTADVIFYGNSHSYCAINEAELWKRYGIAACNMGESSQSIGSTYYYIKESLKTQKPQYILVEVYPAIVSEGSSNIDEVYRNTINMHWSTNYLNNLKYSIASMNNANELFESILFKIPVIHSRYNELSRMDYVPDDYKMGRYTANWSYTAFDTPNNASNQYMTPIAESSAEYIQKICDLAKENNICLGFWEAPYYISDYDYTRLNTVKDIAKKNGIVFMNFNDYYEEQGIDFTKDFFDTGHLNSYGAVKISNSFGEYLSKECMIPDRRGDEKYAIWDEIERNWNHDIQKEMLVRTATLTEYISLLTQTEDTIIVIEIPESFTEKTDATIRKLFEQLGINQQSFEKGGIFVKENDAFLFYSNENSYLWHMELDSKSYAAKSDLAVRRDENGTTVVVDNQDYRKVEDGINIVVYDYVLNQVIDVVGFSGDEGFPCVRN